MKKLNLNDVCLYVEHNIETFHKKRIQSLDSLRLSQVLKRKNPYLFKAKYVLTAEQIVKNFFAQNKPSGFSINQTGNSTEGSQYAIGTLTTAKGKFRVYFLVKKSLITQLQFEQE